jgi:hypothetical protein
MTTEGAYKQFPNEADATKKIPLNLRLSKNRNLESFLKIPGPSWGGWFAAHNLSDWGKNTPTVVSDLIGNLEFFKVKYF